MELRVEVGRLQAFVAGAFAAAGMFGPGGRSRGRGPRRRQSRRPRQPRRRSRARAISAGSPRARSRRVARSRWSPRTTRWRRWRAITGSAPRSGARPSRSGSRRPARPARPWIALRHAGHLGRIGQWAEMALESGFASVHFVNVAGSMLVAPHGGVDRRFSTAPIAMGFPVPGEEPVVLDFATLGRGRGQGAGRVARRQEAARRQPDRARWNALRRSVRPLRPPRALRTARPQPRRGARSGPWATTRARASPSCASCSAAR